MVVAVGVAVVVVVAAADAAAAAWLVVVVVAAAAAAAEVVVATCSYAIASFAEPNGAKHWPTGRSTEGFSSQSQAQLDAFHALC